MPKGTRDFSPVEMAKRNYIFNTIRDVFHLFGYQQIETPSMENLSTLMGKYGDEGDKLLFKIQNFLSNVIKFNRYGAQTVLRRDVTASSISVMPMWWAAIRC